MIKARENLIGAWAFLAGLIIAIVMGIISSVTKITTDPFLYGVLAALGIIMGYFVAEKDVRTFLLATVSVVVVCFAGIQAQILNSAIIGIGFNRLVGAILGALLMLFIPSAIVVALKTVFSLAKS
jgi:hypothetical protein